MTAWTEYEQLIKTAAMILSGICLALFFYASFKYSQEKTKRNRNKAIRSAILFLFSLVLWISLLYLPVSQNQSDIPFVYEEIAEYTDVPYTEINGNRPYFTDEEKQAEPYQTFSELDSLGRCGPAMAMLERSMMPEEEREPLDSIKPSGYHNEYYEDLIEDGFLYNRCHLIGFQLTGENANAKNLITGTRYFNTEGMEPFENQTASYIRLTKNHVLYRITPVFIGKELVCRGVLMEAYSIEDKGEGICYCVFCYNVQPGIEINYSDGTSRRAN